MTVWGLLAIAITLEVCGTVFLKLSNGFTEWTYGTASILCYVVCFGFLAEVLKTLPVGVTYAIWAGLGITGVTLISYVLFDQKLSPIQFAFMLSILIGAIGLNLTTKAAS